MNIRPVTLTLAATGAELLAGYTAPAGTSASHAHSESTGDAPPQDKPVPSEHGSHTHHATGDGAERVATGGLAASQDGYTLWLRERTMPIGQPHPLTFHILGPDGKPVTEFTPQHEHELHAVVVRSDLKHFQHLHPTRGADGKWSVPITLSEGGSYRLFADFVTGTAELVLGTTLFAPGSFTPEPLPAASPTAHVDDYHITLARSERLQPGQEAELRFSITRPGSKTVSLTPTMGAAGHLVAIREGDLAYLHAHPVSEEPLTDNPASVAFRLQIPGFGRYRLFFQFADAGRGVTAPFTLDVPPSIMPASDAETHTTQKASEGHSPHGKHGH